MESTNLLLFIFKQSSYQHPGVSTTNMGMSVIPTWGCW